MSKSKKILLIVGGIILLAIIGKLMGIKGGDTKPTNETATNVEKAEPVNQDSIDAVNFTASLKREIKSIKEGTDFTSFYQSKETLANIIVLFKVRARFIKQANEGSSPDDMILAKELESLTKKEQIQEFPKVRKAFFEFIKQDLWKEDVNLKLMGKKNTILDFTGSTFARNKSIAEAQEILNETFNMYRFKRTQYRWSDIAREYTSYDLPSPDDDEIILSIES